MVEDVLKLVRKAEEDAEKLIVDAKNKTSDILREAEKDAKKIIEDLEAEGNKEAQIIVDKVKKEGESEAKKIIDAEEKKAAKLEKESRKNLGDSVKIIIDSVLNL